MTPDWIARGERTIALEASVVTDGGLRKVAAILEVDVEQMVRSSGFPPFLDIPGARGRYVRRDALLAWLRSR